LTLTLLLLVFALPPLLGWFYIMNPDWLPHAKNNHGTLIDPVRPVTGLQLMSADNHPFDWQRFSGQWLIASHTHGHCLADCLKQQTDLFQVERALGADRRRVDRLLIQTAATEDATTLALPQGTHVAILPASEQSRFDQLFTLQGITHDQAIYLIDPLGNLMMVHDPASPPKALLKDLKILLKASNSWGKGDKDEHR
jgi:cytochrome oxidase Cu insertion factor (SCO1/SenC/PrrC family)